MPIPVLQYFLKKKQECTVISSFADRPCSWSLHFNAPNVLNSSFIFSKPPQLLTVNKQSSVVSLTHSAHLGQSEVRTAALPQRWSSTPCRSSASSSSSIFPSSAALPRPPPRFLPRLPLPPLPSPPLTSAFEVIGWVLLRSPAGNFLPTRGSPGPLWSQFPLEECFCSVCGDFCVAAHSRSAQSQNVYKF